MKSTAPLTKPMREAITKSGYLMEQRLVPLIESFGYKATPNERFRDPETGEVRELDISAITASAIRSREHEYIFPMLLVACKNLRCPLVFFTQQEIRMEYFLGTLQVSGIPLDVKPFRGQHQRLTEFLRLEKFHHYYRTGHIASQFCAVYETKKSGHGAGSHQTQYEAGHAIDGRIDLFRDFETLIHALESEKKDHAQGSRPDTKRGEINLQFYYPIFVTSGPLIECYVAGRRPRYRSVHRVGFLLRHAKELLSKEYRIDVVDEIGLKRLLNVIQDETDKMANRIKRQRKLLLKSALTIARRLHTKSQDFRCAYFCGEKELW